MAEPQRIEDVDHIDVEIKIATASELIRKVTTKAYCFDLHDFAEVVYGVTGDDITAHHVNKWEQMSDSFFTWFNELDDQLRYKFIEYCMR